MNDWDRFQWYKRTNPSGEVIRVKRYIRQLVAWDNLSEQDIVEKRKKLADLLQVPYHDLLADLNITIEIHRYPRHRRFLKYMPWKAQIPAAIPEQNKEG